MLKKMEDMGVEELEVYLKWLVQAYKDKKKIGQFQNAKYFKKKSEIAKHLLSQKE